MKITAALVFATSLCILSGCNSMKVTSQCDPRFDFAGIQSYEWIAAPTDIDEEEKENLYVNKDFQEALNNELSARGLRQVLQTAEADVQTAYYIKLEEHEEYTTMSSPSEPQVTSGFVYKHQQKTWDVKEQSPDINVYTVETGTLAMIVYDAKSGARVWTGTLKTKIDRSRPLAKQKEHIREAARELMKQFPCVSE